MMRDAGPPRLDSSSGPFGYDEVRPLLDALRDPVQVVRTGALRALVRLPLREEVWLDVGDFFWQELAPPVGDGGPETRVEPTVPHRELINAAIYVPIAPIRQRLHELVERGAEEERRVAAHALAWARDAAAIPQLMADLSDPDVERRVWAAESLSLLDVTPVRERLRQVCLEDEDGDVRFWLALALARLGDTEGIRGVLLDWEREAIEVRYLWGDPMVLSDRVAGRGPFPAVVNDVLQQIATDEFASDHLRQVANDLLHMSVPAPSGEVAEVDEERDLSLASEAFTEQAGDLGLRQQAAELAAAYVERSPFDDQTRGLPWEQAQILAHLPPVSATSLVSVLFAHLVRQFPPGERTGAGNAIMQLPQAMWRSFVPDISALFESYVALGEQDVEVRWQLAWAMSRAGLRRLLVELAPRLAVADEAERIAVVRLIEEAILYSRFSHGPVFGGGAPPAHVPPTVESFIELEREEAVVGGERRLELEITPKGLVPEPGPGPEPRWLQGQLYEIDEEREIRLDRALRADALHRLVVRIGAADEEWITAPEDAAFPIEELPEDQEGYELRIVFSEPYHVPQPLADTIYLPRLRGNSTTCEFEFRTRRDVAVFEGRVVVMYGNRILQTMFLVAQVLPEPVHAPPDAAIEFKPETAVRANLAGLDSREPFDVALVADTGSDGMMHVAGFTGERVELRSLENVEQPIKRMRRRLSQIASSPEDFRDLNSEATQNLLRFLARQGSLLYDGIVRTQVGESGVLNDEDRRIQLVSARESFLPLEFMYDHPSPLPEAGLCPGAREALQTGQCAYCDQLDDEARRAYVCPLGFWCMSRVIERHAVKPVAETNLSGTEYALQSDPIAGRDTLNVLNAAVCAASNRVQEAQIEELLETLTDVTDHRVERVLDWDTWRTAVQSRNPSVLVLLPHTLEDADAIPALEIGEEQQLPEDQITASHVHTARDYHPPVVLLLGCETAEPDVPFQAFAVQFRIHGAAIVLSTLTPVLGRHAVPVAQMLLGELKRAARASGTFGDALLGLRRRALAAGIPMVLSLVAYGDADWRLYSDTTVRVPVDEP